VVAHQFLTPVNRTTLTGDIYRKMVAHLLRGDWSPGEQIPPERELCQQLGVGRASLREALKALEIMGMIETRLGDGTYVCERSEFLSRPLLWAITSSSEGEAQELVEARQLIEIELAGLAAERANSADLKEIGVHLDKMESSLHDVEQFLRSDIAFHLAVAQASHNNILMNALLLIRNLLHNWISSTLRIAGVAEKALEQHQRIFLTIAKKNPAAARSAMQTHLQDMANFLLASEKAQKSRASASADRSVATDKPEKSAAKHKLEPTTSQAPS
jgi:GntR family transcriptional regulator, transcriptional repressor for pyruvate dehydrogenase complex